MVVVVRYPPTARPVYSLGDCVVVVAVCQYRTDSDSVTSEKVQWDGTVSLCSCKCCKSKFCKCTVYQCCVRAMS